MLDPELSTIRAGKLSGKRILLEELVVELVAKPLGHRALEVRRQVGAQGAEFSFRTSVQAKLEAGTLVPGAASQVLVIENAVVDQIVEIILLVDRQPAEVRDAVIAGADVVAEVAADLEAGFSPRDVVEAGAVYVADANVLDRLRLGDDDRVGGARTGDCDQGRSGAEK